jgi:hypothetical protein
VTERGARPDPADRWRKLGSVWSGIDLNKPRIRAGLHAALALTATP